MIFWIVWFVVGIGFAGVLTVVVIPRILLNIHAAAMPLRDRAIKRISDENGLILYYEPAAAARRFLKTYRITSDSRGKIFQAAWARKIAFAEYELVVYNANDEIIQILRIRETFNGNRTTHPTQLPDKTDFVSLRIVTVDDETFPAERRQFNLRFAMWVGVLCLALAVTVDVLLWMSFTFVLRCMDGFSQTLAVPVGAWAKLLGYTALAVTVLTLCYALAQFFLLRERRPRHGN